MTRKYEYHAVIQQHYGQGWADVSEYKITSTGRHLERNIDGKPLIRQDLKGYQEMGYPTRIIKRRTKIA